MEISDFSIEEIMVKRFNLQLIKWITFLLTLSLFITFTIDFPFYGFIEKIHLNNITYLNALQQQNPNLILYGLSNSEYSFICMIFLILGCLALIISYFLNYFIKYNYSIKKHFTWKDIREEEKKNNTYYVYNSVIDISFYRIMFYYFVFLGILIIIYAVYVVTDFKDTDLVQQYYLFPSLDGIRDIIIQLQENLFYLPFSPPYYTNIWLTIVIDLIWSIILGSGITLVHYLLGRQFYSLALNNSINSLFKDNIHASINDMQLKDRLFIDESLQFKLNVRVYNDTIFINNIAVFPTSMNSVTNKEIFPKIISEDITESFEFTLKPTKTGTFNCYIEIYGSFANYTRFSSRKGKFFKLTNPKIRLNVIEFKVYPFEPLLNASFKSIIEKEYLYVSLDIQNVGKGAAHDISFSFYGPKTLKLYKGIEMVKILRPEKIFQGLTSKFVNNGILPLEMKLEISYKDEDNNIESITKVPFLIKQKIIFTNNGNQVNMIANNNINNENIDINNANILKIVSDPLYEFLDSTLLGKYPNLSEDLIQILKTPHNETLWLEKKLRYNLSSENDWKEFILDILSISNAVTNKPIGIFIGVDDDTGEFCNVSLQDEATIRQNISAYIKPEVDYVLNSIKFPDNKHGYIIAIRPSKFPYSLKKDLKINGKILVPKGSIWIRKGSSKDKLDTDGILKLQKDKEELFN